MNAQGIMKKTDAISADFRKRMSYRIPQKMNADQSSAKIQSFKQQFDNLRNEAAKLDTQINDIMDNQESINIELDTSESLENDLNINIEKEQKRAGRDPRKGKQDQKIRTDSSGICRIRAKIYDLSRKILPVSAKRSINSGQ